MNNSSFTFIYDGECPFCNHFAELLELKSKVSNIYLHNKNNFLKLLKKKTSLLRSSFFI